MEANALRSLARKNLAGNWGLSIGAAAIACLLGGMLTGSSFLPNIEWRIPISELQEFHGTLQQGIHFGNVGFSIRNGIFGLVTFLIGGTIQLGYTDFLLKQHDGRDFQFGDLFSQFHRFGQGFAQQFLRGLYTTLWMLLFIIPGIMASYSYAMTPFLMAENPDLTASEAISKSKDMMDGYKGELFFLDLSFFGWLLLAAITGGPGFLVLNPYTNAARAAFYRRLQAEYRAKYNG